MAEERAATLDKDTVEAGITKIRRLRILFKWILITFVPLVFLMAFLRIPEKIMLGIGFTVIGLGIIVEITVYFSRCPACGKYFHVHGMSGSIFTKECVHCGIPLKPKVKS